MCRGGFGRVEAVCLIPKGVEFVEMDMLVLRVDVPKEGFAGKLGTDETVFATYHGAVGEVQQFVEILLRHERDFDEAD